MFYVKAKLSEGVTLEVEIEDGGNTYTRCADCGREFLIDWGTCLRAAAICTAVATARNAAQSGGRVPSNTPNFVTIFICYTGQAVG